MASSKPIPCGPCQEGNESTKAEFWCHNCEEGLCSTCSGHHKRSKLSRDHKNIDIKSCKPSIQAIIIECDKHGLQLNLYCSSHLMPCCDQCISTSHSKCTGIKSLRSVVEKTKVEKSKASVDKAEIHMNREPSVRVAKTEVPMNREPSVRVAKTEVPMNREPSVRVAKTEVPMNREPSMRVAKTEVAMNREPSVRVAKTEVPMNREPSVRVAKTEVPMNREPSVRVAKTEVPMNRETSVRGKAQVESREQSNINNMAMNIETKIKIKLRNVTDMICLMDGRIIVVDKNGKVNPLTSDGKLKKKLPIPGEAWSVTQINQNTIAITFPTEKAIRIFNMENKTVTKVITFDKECRGLSFSNNSLAVGLSNDEIHIIDLEGNTLKLIQVPSGSYLEHLVYCNDRVTYSDFNGNVVYCYDESGKQIWQYQQDLSAPKGLCTDTYGNIIVVDYRSYRIIVISKDGQNSRVLISEEDGLWLPRCFCFKHNESSGFIYDTDSIYKVKSNLSSG
ncbi:uncharacterized protein LOC127736392 isoform X3 [Mytilus californianus]|uniref:uncharacterized protein LOC127736392 isoform X3 n=1 Tax=Mytilus californianus TaxID=6549 RepID=UPI0022481D1C|nr:uncharacterized protein LOC127736392 isoform X3 [Mytilus californianus]